MPRPTHRGRVFLSSLLVWCTLLTPFQSALATETTSQPSPILIGEVQWSGSSRSIADEWLELWNTGTEPVSLAGWSLVGASEKPLFFTNDNVLAPQQTLLIANYASTSDKTVLTAHTIAITTSSLSLSNDQLFLELRDAAGVVRDSAGTNTKPPAGTSLPVNTSMIRTATNSGWTWRSATSTFDPNIPDLGSPGVCDECTPTFTPPVVTEPVEPVEEEEEEEEEEEVELELELEDEELAPLELSPYEPSLVTTTTSEALTQVQETTSSSEILVPTSTEEVIPFEDTTSSSVTAPTSTLTVSSTQEVPTTTSVSEPPTPAPTPAPVITSPPPTPVSLPTPPPPEPVLLDPVITELVAAPNANEDEWIELRLPENTNPLRYINWKLESDGKTIFTLTTTTIQALNPQGAYLLPAWKTSKLKNAGATVRLKRADGTIAQEVTYSNSLRGTSWMRDDLSAGWQLTYRPTKGAANIFEAAPVPIPAANKTVAAPATKASTTTETSSEKMKVSITAPPTSTDVIRALETATKKTVSKSTATSTAKATSKTTTKKAAAPKQTTAKKSLVIPTTVTHFEQIPPEQLSPKVRVRLQGLVGSTVGVFGKQKFILLASDGRGLLVKTTTAQPSPALGETIELTGLLFANDDGVQLQMETGDVWKKVNTTTTSTPRLIEWTAPGLEDQWSFTKLEGLVTDSRASAITLESHVGEVTIPIKAILGYRAQRVKVGDTIEVSGVFDGRGGIWKIQPAQASDIVILGHPEPATKTAATSPSNTKLPWNALGIAVGSIGAVEGIRRWLERRKATKLIPQDPFPLAT